MVDTGAAVAGYVAELEAAAARVLRSGRYILGPEVKAFEEEASAYLGAAHGVGVSSGTDGLYLALRALDVGSGDEVLVPAFGFVATVEAVVRAGARPVFVDVLPACGRIDLTDADKKRTARTRAIIHVPLAGQGSGTGAVARWAAQRSVFMIEDAAQSFGALDEGRAIGTFGAIGWLGAWYTWDEYRFEVLTPGLGVPSWYYTVWMPLVSAIICLRILGRMWRVLRAGG